MPGNRRFQAVVSEVEVGPDHLQDLVGHLPQPLLIPRLPLSHHPLDLSPLHDPNTAVSFPPFQAHVFVDLSALLEKNEDVLAHPVNPELAVVFPGSRGPFGFLPPVSVQTRLPSKSEELTVLGCPTPDLGAMGSVWQVPRVLDAGLPGSAGLSKVIVAGGGVPSTRRRGGRCVAARVGSDGGGIVIGAVGTAAARVASDRDGIGRSRLLTRVVVAIVNTSNRCW